MKRGFTLLELLVVIAIIAMLSSIIIASLGAARERGRLAAGRQFSAQINRALGADGGFCFPLDEGSGSTATDIVSNQSSPITGSPTWTNDTPDGSAGALLFDGASTQNIGITPTGNLISATTKSFTYGLWVKPTTLIGGWLMAQQGYHEGLGIGNGGIPAATIYFSDNTALTYYSPKKISIGKWYYLAMSVDDLKKTVSIYIDGALAGRSSYTGTLRDYGTTAFRIGGLSAGLSAAVTLDNPCFYLNSI